MIRLPDWEPRFASVLAYHQKLPFVYGGNDCMIFAGHCIEALTGEDLYSDHLGKYATADESKAYLKSLSFASSTAFFNSFLEQKEPAYCQRGDIILDSEGWIAVCIGATAVSPGEMGLIRHPQQFWSKAWAV